MKLGIAGRKALLCASNAGLGLACAKAIAAEGVDVVVNGRNPEKIAAAVAEVKAVATGNVTHVQADVTTDAGRAALLSVCPNPDILLNNNAGPKPKRFMETERQDWEDTYRANYLSPILLVHAILPSMLDRGFGRYFRDVNSGAQQVFLDRDSNRAIYGKVAVGVDPGHVKW